MIIVAVATYISFVAQDLAVQPFGDAVVPCSTLFRQVDFCRQYGKNQNSWETLKNWVVRNFPAGCIFILPDSTDDLIGLTRRDIR